MGLATEVEEQLDLSFAADAAGHIEQFTGHRKIPSPTS